jgi:hypothetical protein
MPPAQALGPMAMEDMWDEIDFIDLFDQPAGSTSSTLSTSSKIGRPGQSCQSCPKNAVGSGMMADAHGFNSPTDSDKEPEL